MNGTEPLESFLKGVWNRTWQLFQAQALTFILAGLLMFVIIVVSLGILSGPMFAGYIEMVRKAGRNETVEVSDIFKGFDYFLSSFGATIVLGVAMFIGFLLLFLPGIAVALFTTFTLHAITFERLGVFAAIGRSMRLVRDHFVNVLVLFILVGAAQSIGGSVLLGVILTTPLSIIALTAAFERIAAPQAIPAGAPVTVM